MRFKKKEVYKDYLKYLLWSSVQRPSRVDFYCARGGTSRVQTAAYKQKKSNAFLQNFTTESNPCGNSQ